MTIFYAVLLLGILIFIHELGHFIFAKLSGVKVLKFSLGFGPKLIGKKIGETEYLISALPLGGYVKPLGEEPGEEVAEEEKRRSLPAQPLSKRALIIVAGPVFNILLTYVIFSFVLSIGLPIAVPILKNMLPVVGGVQPGFPAEAAGLQQGDTIVSINGKKISTWIDMMTIVSANPGKPLTIVVKRNGQLMDFVITPKAVQDQDLQGKSTVVGKLGVTRSGFAEQIKSDSLLDVPIKGAVATYKWGMIIFDSIGMMISGEISAKENLGGPVTIISESSKAASAGILPYLMFMALLSVNLGVLNLLPIPVLDGGHLLFLGIEAIRGKPLSEQSIAIAQRVGLAILITLMAFALYSDIFRLIGGKLF